MEGNGGSYHPEFVNHILLQTYLQRNRNSFESLQRQKSQYKRLRDICSVSMKS